MPLVTSLLTCALAFGAMFALGTHYSWQQMSAGVIAAAVCWYIAYAIWAYRAWH